jgi:hypothetical protein
MYIFEILSHDVLENQNYLQLIFMLNFNDHQ